MRKPFANVTLTIDGRQVTVPDGTRVIEAAGRVGIHIPHYCYHPLLSIAGSCRLCLVEIEGSKKMMLACDTVAREGMVVRTDTPQVADARRGMMEFFLINHPLDCPICDRGGECMLHRYTMDHGPGHTRTVEPRLRFRKPQLDPLLDLERNRCVVCTRCVRFMDEIAGEHCIGVFQRGDVEYIATFNDGPIRSIFSGMIIDLCPVGTWTSKPFRFRARNWELQQVQSTCPYCASGCAATLWMRAGQIHRVTPLTSPEKANFQISYDERDVICNQGRFGCDFANRPDRLKTPRLRRRREDGSRGDPEEVDWNVALDEAARRLGQIRAAHGPDAIGLLASSRATCEEMYLLQRLARDVVGTNNVDWRTGAANPAAARALSAAFGRSTGQLDDLDCYDVILLLHADLLAKVPVAALKIKEAARLRKSQVFVLDHRLDGWLTRYARGVVQYPIELAERVIEGLERGSLVAARPFMAAGWEAAEDLLRALREARNGLIVYGLDGCNQLFADRWVGRIALLAESLGPTWKTLPVVAERNAAGAFLVGCQPDRLPGGWSDDADVRRRAGQQWSGALPTTPGMSAPEMIEAAREGRLKALYVLGSSDFHALPWLDSVLAAFERLELLIVHDVFESPLSERADIVLPGAFFSEKEGTLVNIAGSPAPFAKGWSRPSGVQDDAAVLDGLAQKMGKSFGYRDVGAVFEEMMRLINPACPLKAGALCEPGPGEEWPVRCLNLPTSRARLNPGKFRTVCPIYRAVCRLTMGAKPRSFEAPVEAPGPGPTTTELRLVWSPVLRGADQFGDRSEVMAPLRDPARVEIHPGDAGRLGVSEGDLVTVAAAGVSASGRLRVTENVAPGLVYVPENGAGLRFSTPPSALPEVTVRPVEAEVGPSARNERSHE
jgi:NADH-quinone oxidoreductase chain G